MVVSGKCAPVYIRMLKHQHVAVNCAIVSSDISLAENVAELFQSKKLNSFVLKN